MVSFSSVARIGHVVTHLSRAHEGIFGHICHPDIYRYPMRASSYLGNTRRDVYLKAIPGVIIIGHVLNL